jgi:hypothetical protein
MSYERIEEQERAFQEEVKEMLAQTEAGETDSGSEPGVAGASA